MADPSSLSTAVADDWVSVGNSGPVPADDWQPVGRQAPAAAAPDLYGAVEDVESGGRQSAVSSKGAIGAMQLMPAAARQASTDLGIPFNLKRLRTDATYNRVLGRQYLNGLLDRYGGNQAVALAAYNSGPGTVDAWLKRYGNPSTGEVSEQDWLGKLPYNETRNYVASVQARLKPQLAATPSEPVPQAAPPASSIDDWQPVGAPEPPISGGARMTTTGAFVHGTERGVAPALAGFVGLGAGAELGAAAGALTGPAAPVAVPVLSIVGALAGAFGGGYLADEAQEYLLSKLPEDLKDYIGQSAKQRAAEGEEHPIAAVAGELLPSLLTMRPGATLPAREGATAIERLLAKPLVARGAGAALVGGQEAAQEEAGGEPLNPEKIGVSAGFGALLNRPTALGQRLERAGARLIPGATARALPAAPTKRSTGEPPPAAPVPPGVTPAAPGMPPPGALWANQPPIVEPPIEVPERAAAAPEQAVPAAPATPAAAPAQEAQGRPTAGPAAEYEAEQAGKREKIARGMVGQVIEDIEARTGRTVVPPQERFTDPAYLDQALHDFKRKANAMGVTYRPDVTLDELAADVYEREARQAESAAAKGDTADMAERDAGALAASAFDDIPWEEETYATRRETAPESTQPPGAPAEAGEGRPAAEEAGRAAEPYPPPGTGRATQGERAAGLTESTEQGEQFIMPGGERSAKQAQASREAEGHGRIRARAEQRGPGPLFEGKKTEEPTLFQAPKEAPVPSYRSSEFVPAGNDIVAGDTIRFREAVFGGSYRKPQYLGDRTVTAFVRRESYGADKQQHTFSLRVLDSSGVEPLSKGSETTRKGRNIYRNGAERLSWADETQRKTISQEKHVRGAEARAVAQARREKGPLFHAGKELQGAMEEERVSLTPGLEAEVRPTKAFTANEDAIISEVSKIAEKMFPGTRLRFFDALHGKLLTGDEMPVYGAFYQDGPANVIAMSLRAADHIGTIRHEGFHFLRQTGMITPEQWAILKDAAERNGWLGKHEIWDRYGHDFPYESAIEEAVAEEFGLYGREVIKGIPAPVARVFRKIQMFFNRVAATARKFLGDQATASDIFEQIKSGEIGRRAAEEAPKGRAAARFQAQVPKKAAEEEPPFATPRERRQAGFIARSAIGKIFSPATVSPIAEKQAALQRMEYGRARRMTQQARAAIQHFRDTAPNLGTPEGNNLMAFMEGRSAGTELHDPNLGPVADMVRSLNKDRMRALKELPEYAQREFIEDYFSHMWQDRKRAQQFFSTTRGGGWQGSGRSLKERVIPTYADGIAAGFKPLFPNIIDGEMAYLSNMDRFIATNRIFQQMRATGTAKYFIPGKQPDGWVELNGRLGAKSVPTAEGGAIPMRAYAPEDAARVYNNTISRGYYGTDLEPVYDKLMRASNAMTMAELSLSLFHANTMATEAMISQVAGAIGRARHLDILGALKDVATFPAAPLRAYLKGRKMVSEYLEPGSQGGRIAQVMNLLTEANLSPLGRGESQYFAALRGPYKSLRDFGQAMQEAAQNIRDEPLRGSLREIGKNVGRTLDTISAPLFDHAIPRLKAGAAFERMSDWIDQHPNAGHEEQLQAARDISDSIDNRFGELVYDNVTWNRIMKQTGQLAIRAVGWDLGTQREVMGGAFDIARGRFTPRVEYVIALAAVSTFLNGVATYLKTGQAPTGMDFFAYKTGAKNPDGTPERAMMPGYAREYVSLVMNMLARGPIAATGSYAWGKVASLWHTAWELFTNRDWRDDPIGPPNANLSTPQGRKDMGEFLSRYLTYGLSHYVPISLREPFGLQSRKQVGLGVTPLEQALAIRKAPFTVQNPKAAAAFFKKMETRTVPPTTKWQRKLARERGINP